MVSLERTPSTRRRAAPVAGPVLLGDFVGELADAAAGRPL